MSNLRKICQLGTWLFFPDRQTDRQKNGRADGRTDREADMTKLVVTICSFENALKTRRSFLYLILISGR